MAAMTPDKMVLEIETSFDAGELAAGVKKIETEIAKRVDNVRKKTRQLEKSITSFSKKVLPTYKQWGKEGDRVLKIEKKLATMSTATANKLTQLQIKLRDATEGETKAIETQITKIQERYKLSQQELTSQLKLSRVRQALDKKQGRREKAGQDAHDDFVSYDFSDAGKDIFEGFKDGVHSLSSKDLGGVIKGLSKGLGSAMRGAGAGITRRLASAGEGGAGGQIAGISKVMGSLFKSVGPLLGMLGKIAPIIGAVSGMIAGIVKLVIDAEAAAKDFNRQILDTAGSAQFLGRNMGRVTTGARDLKSTLKKIYDDATSLDNMDWGINKETHAAVLNSLTAEGVSLKRLEKDFENTAKAAKGAEGYAKSYGSTVQMSVAYSRMFGVSLNEITQFQSEMMVEMGASLVTVQKQFHMMTKGAEEAGIASNKFFGIIRAVSADLSLYNTRMEDTVHMLTMLGKVMNPKNAQQFLQASMGAVKNMGRTERLKVGLLMGGKDRKEFVDNDAKRSADKLAQTLSDAVGGSIPLEEIQAAVKNGGQAFEKVLSKADKEQQGTLREARSELAMKKKMGEGGAYGQSLALGEMDNLSQAEAMAKAMKRFGGKGTLADNIGKLGVNAMADNLGVSIESLKQNAKLEAAILDQKDILKAGFARGDKTVKDRLSKVLGHEIKDSSEIDQLGYAQVGDAIDETTKEQILASNKAIDYAKDTAGFQTSLLSKIDNLMEWITNKIYNVMTGIWESVADVVSWFTGGTKDKNREIEIAAAKSKDKRAIDAFEDSGGDLQKFRESLAQTVKQDLTKNLVAAQEQLLGLQEALAAEEDPKKKAVIAAKINDMQKKRADDEALLLRDPKQSLDAMGGAGGGMFQKMSDQLVKLNADEDQHRALANYKDKQGPRKEFGIQDTAEFQKLSKADQEKVLQQVMANSVWTLGPEALIEATKKLNYGKATEQGGAASDATSGPPAPPVSEQAQATARSAAPGTAGAAPMGPPPPPKPASLANTANALLATPAVTMSDADKEGLSEDQLAVLTEQGSTIADIFRALRVKGVRIDWKFHGEDLAAAVEQGVLAGSRVALLEYFLYSQMGVDSVKAALKGGMDPKAIGANVLEMTKRGDESKTITAPANARGGMVLNPAPGEALASVKPLSEAIVPLSKLKGGGGANNVVELRLTGDLARFIDARVIDGNVKFNKNAKTR